MRTFKYTVLLLVLSTTWLSQVRAQTRAAEVLVDSIKNKNQTTPGVATSTRPIWLFSPLRISDSTASSLKLYDFWTYRDSSYLRLMREITGNQKRAFFEVRDDGTFNPSSYFALRAVNRGADSASALIGVTTTGEVFGSGRRVNPSTNAVTGAFNRFFKAMNDSFIVYVDGAEKVRIENTGLTGALITSLGSIIDGTYLEPGSVIASKLVESAQAFSTDIVFSSPHKDTVKWTAGTVKFAYSSASISAGAVYLSSLTYVYLDLVSSPTAFLTTTNYATVVADASVLMCVANAAASSGQTAFFVPAVGVLGVNETNISANSISADKIQANAVTAAKISVVDLAAVSTTTGTLNILTGGYLRSGQTAYDAGTGFYLGNDGGTPKFSIGNSAGNKFTWDGTDLNVVGRLRTSTGTKRVEVVGDTMTFYVGNNPIVWLGSNISSGAAGLRISEGIVTVSNSSGQIPIQAYVNYDLGGIPGIFGSSTGTGAFNYVGGSFNASPSNSSSTAYGVEASATGSGQNMGIYASALGGTTNWAGYFVDGNVRIQDTLYMPTGGDVGDVWTKMNTAGKGAWQTLGSGTDSVYRVLYSASSDTTVSSEVSVFQKVFKEVGAGTYAAHVNTFYVKQPGDSAIVAKFLFTLKKGSVGGRAKLNIGSAPEVAKTASVTDTVVTLRASLWGLTTDSSYTMTFDLRSDDATDTVIVKNLTIYAVKYVTVVAAAGSGSGLDSTVVDTLSVLFVPNTAAIFPGTTTTGLWGADSTIRVIMFEIPHAMRVDTVYHRQTSASTNDTIVYALYDRDRDLKWRTTVQLTDGGTTTVYKMPVVTPVLVPAGTYYWAWMASGGYNPSSNMAFSDAQVDTRVTVTALSGYGLPIDVGSAANKWSPSANSVPSTLGTITGRGTGDNWVPPVAIIVGAK